jgi:hypothetical protein
LGVKAVFGIAGQFLPKNLLLVEQPENDKWDDENEGR